jgi:hypothetical protein
MSGTRNSNLPETVIRFSDSIHEPTVYPAIYEDQIKARLQTITSFVEGLNTSTVDVLLAEKPFARELLQELIVKEAALRWIVRVATLSNENVRARLWADIDKALDNLDLIVDLVGRANIEWPVNDVLQFSDELAYIK